MVTGSGEVLTFSKEKDGELFNGVVVNLGALGIITKVTLALEPAFTMHQRVYVNLPFSQLQDNFDAIVSAGYSVSLFTNWLTNSFSEVWVKDRYENGNLLKTPKEFYGAPAATQNMHPIFDMPSENCTEQLGLPGPWYDRLPHFKMGFTPSSGVELQSEYFVARQHAVEAIRAVARLGKQIGPYVLVSEIRTIAPDNFWLSPCYQQASVALHFTWQQDWPAVSKLLPLLEKELAPFKARPHWGKLFVMPHPELAARYEKLPDFIKLIKQYDPLDKFRNEFLNTTIYGG
jgi:xylitol oxidase